jgi:lysophospholipase L1-like esterase
MANPALFLSRLQAVAGIFLILIALLLNPWFVEAFIVRDGTLDQKSYVLVANAILIAAGLLLIWRARMTRNASINTRSLQIAMTLLLISLGISVLLGEVGARLLLDPQYLFRADENGWWLLRWQRAQAHAEPGALTPENYGYDIYDPVYGWSPRPDYQSTDIRINSQGMRADHDYTIDKDPARLRVLFVGDSFTWGEDVANEDTFAARLERVMPEAESLNLAVHGFGTDQQLIRLRREGLPYRPDVVILGFYEGNLNRNILSFRDYGKPRFDLQDSELLLINQPVPTREEYLARPVPLPGFWLGKLASNVWLSGISATQLHPPLREWDRWQLTSAIFSAAKDAAEAAGAEFLLLYIADSETREAGELEKVTADWAATTDTHLLNLGDVFRARSDQEWDQIYRGHLTPYGNQLAAEAIAAKLQEDVLAASDQPGSAPNKQAQ